MSPLVRTDDLVDALAVYDGDVIEHPDTGQVMTVAAHWHMDPHYLELMAGIVRFDIYSEIKVDGLLQWDGPVDQLVIHDGMRIRPLYEYVVPPHTRIR